ncbi:glycosyltransferase family 2 protein [Spiribacter roseus]|uniref:Glycosyltransferase family 2 protein n=1 Tax=Spiribacter roseus TaxID=1855875 RepID=A0ABV3RX53_9GAMM
MISDISEQTSIKSGANTETETVPVAVVMITLNEAHNMEAVLQNLKGWAQQVFVVDSYSADATVDIALAHGVHVVQRRFLGFGDQWNFALENLPIKAPWTMKLDPDERLSDQLKRNIGKAIKANEVDGLEMKRRLWFMGKPLPIRQRLLRAWRTDTCRFSEVLVNEHPLVTGQVNLINGDLEHHDSPDLHHWFEKQNRYSTAEALSAFRGSPLAERPSLFGSSLQRRMWFKRLLRRLPLQGLLMFAYCYFLQGAWRAGRVGWIWSSLRAHVHRMRALKLMEMRIKDEPIRLPPSLTGSPHPDVQEIDYDTDGSAR